MEDRRRARRARTFLGARAVFNKGNSTMQCIVRNLSDNGALLHFESVVGLPDEFTLVFDDGAQSRICVVDHRHPNAVGVVFKDYA